MLHICKYAHVLFSSTQLSLIMAYFLFIESKYFPFTSMCWLDMVNALRLLLFPPHFINLQTLTPLCLLFILTGASHERGVSAEPFPSSICEHQFHHQPVGWGWDKEEVNDEMTEEGAALVAVVSLCGCGRCTRVGGTFCPSPFQLHLFCRRSLDRRLLEVTVSCQISLCSLWKKKGTNE